MSPERQKIVIFSVNCHLSDGSAAGSGCLREEDMMPDNMSLIEPRRYYPDMLMLGKNARVNEILMTKNLFIDAERDCKSVWNGMCFQ